MKIQSSFIETRYQAHISTADIRGAGTDATVYLHIFGEHAEHVIYLEKSQHSDPFEAGQVDIFTFELPYLGDLKRVRLGHDGKSRLLGSSADWFPSWLKLIQKVISFIWTNLVIFAL